MNSARIVADVPPESDPAALCIESTTSRVGTCRFAWMQETSDQLKRSAGADSMPIWGMIIAPVETATLWYRWMMS